MTKAAELAKMGEVLTNSQIGGRRNIIINGVHKISQRGTANVTGLGDGDEGYPLTDRWRHTVGAGAGRYTASQEAITDLPGFTTCLKIACTTEDTTIAASERFMLEQRIEGQDLQQLKKGTSDAESVTVSFYVKGHDSATYTVGLYDTDGRQIGATFSVTTSWARQTVTFPGDTSGTLANDNTAQLHLRFFLHGGATYTGGTFATAWESATNANQISNSADSIFESQSATFFITGVQLEVGSQATPFEHRSFGEELALCQRYYWKSFNYATAPADNISNSDGLHSDGFGSWTAFSSTGIRSAFIYNPVAMRGDPTVTLFSSARANTANTPAFYDGGWAAVGSPVLESGELRIGIEAAVSSVTANESFLFAGGYQCDSEL